MFNKRQNILAMFLVISILLDFLFYKVYREIAKLSSSLECILAGLLMDVKVSRLSFRLDSFFFQCKHSVIFCLTFFNRIKRR